MFTIQKDYVKEIIIEKSRFICTLKKVDSEEEAQRIIRMVVIKKKKREKRGVPLAQQENWLSLLAFRSFREWKLLIFQIQVVCYRWVRWLFLKMENQKEQIIGNLE